MVNFSLKFFFLDEKVVININSIKLYKIFFSLLAKPIISINSISSLNLSVGINSEDFNMVKYISEISFNSEILIFILSSPVIGISIFDLIFGSNPQAILYNILGLDTSSIFFRDDSFKQINILFSIFITYLFLIVLIF